MKAGEGVSIEFKRCGNQPAADTFETVCSFANRQGGSIYLGVLDDGSVEGVPAASCRYKGEYYDRVADSDVRVKSADQISLMFIRKQNRFSEQRIYPYLTEADLRLDLIKRAREMALARNPNHPWVKLDNAGLIGLFGLAITSRTR